MQVSGALDGSRLSTTERRVHTEAWLDGVVAGDGGRVDLGGRDGLTTLLVRHRCDGCGSADAADVRLRRL